MAISEFEIKRIEKIVWQFVEKIRPVPEKRNQQFSWPVSAKEKPDLIIFDPQKHVVPYRAVSFISVTKMETLKICPSN